MEVSTIPAEMPPKIDQEPLISPFDGQEELFWSALVAGGYKWNHCGETVGVYLSESDCLESAFLDGLELFGTVSGPLEYFRRKAREFGRVAVVLRSRTGQEIDRWPV